MNSPIEFAEEAVGQLGDMDRYTRSMILNRISDHPSYADGTEGIRTFRIGRYRIVGHVDENGLLVLRVEAGRRHPTDRTGYIRVRG